VDVRKKTIKIWYSEVYKRFKKIWATNTIIYSTGISTC
jgi:hypothetical protein